MLPLEKALTGGRCRSFAAGAAARKPGAKSRCVRLTGRGPCTGPVSAGFGGSHGRGHGVRIGRRQKVESPLEGTPVCWVEASARQHRPHLDHLRLMERRVRSKVDSRRLRYWSAGRTRRTGEEDQARQRRGNTGQRNGGRRRAGGHKRLVGRHDPRGRDDGEEAERRAYWCLHGMFRSFYESIVVRRREWLWIGGRRRYRNRFHYSG